MDSIKYTSNFNNKLLNEFWPDVRLPLGQKFELHNTLEIELERVGFMGYAKIVAVKEFKYKHITDNMAYPVFGQSAPAMRKMLNQFYDYKLNSETNLVHVILHWTQRNPETLHQLFTKPWDKIIANTPNSKQYADGMHLE